MRKYGAIVGLASGLAVLSVVGTVFAHVVVSPDKSQIGAYTEYTMRVPCEEKDATVKVVLTVPADVAFVDYKPAANWHVATHQTKSGQEMVTWQTSGSGIEPGQFEDFSFLAKNPSKSGSIAWNAYQYYQDGTIVEWTGAPGTATPHSMTDILSAAAMSSASAPAGTSTAIASSESSNNTASAFDLGWTTSDTLLLTVSIVAILMSAMAIVFSLRRGSKE